MRACAYNFIQYIMGLTLEIVIIIMWWCDKGFSVEKHSLTFRARLCLFQNRSKASDKYLEESSFSTNVFMHPTLYIISKL